MSPNDSFIAWAGQPIKTALREVIFITYPTESVIAEKLEAIVSIGTLTSRMKDFYDLYIILTTQEYYPDSVKIAVRETFTRRRTPIPELMPEVLTEDAADSPIKQRQWKAFIGRIRSEYGSLSMKTALEEIRQLAADVFDL